MKKEKALYMWAQREVGHGFLRYWTCYMEKSYEVTCDQEPQNMRPLSWNGQVHFQNSWKADCIVRFQSFPPFQRWLCSCRGYSWTTMWYEIDILVMQFKARKRRKNVPCRNELKFARHMRNEPTNQTQDSVKGVLTQGGFWPSEVVWGAKTSFYCFPIFKYFF